MTSELLPLIVRINIALAIAIIVVLQLRAPARRFFGARVAYTLWAIPLVAAAMCFAPGRVEHVVVSATDALIPSYASATGVAAQPPYLLWAWAGGALLSLFILAFRQFRFTQALGKLSVREDLGADVHSAESATHGPAVVGVLKPMIVTPSDFDARFDEEERRIVLAHERAHLAQGDPWINAIVLVVQCLSWFNPLVHLGARALRVDQELACDAAVLAQAESARRRYAEAMLKTHIGAAVPIGCAWPPSDLTSFKERIAMLKRTLPSRMQTIAGVSVIALATAAAAAAAWAAQPARVITTLVPTAAERSVPLQPDSAELIRAHSDDELDGLDALAHLDHLDELDEAHEMSELAALEALDDLENIDLEGGDHQVYINGRLVQGRDLTPEEREEIRQSLHEAREAMMQARIEMREAMRAAHSDARRAELEAARDAMASAREAMQESRVAREAAMAEAREAMAEIDVEAIRAEALVEVRAAIAEARAEVAEEIARARADGDADRLRELRDAERALSDVEREHHNDHE